MSASDKKKLRKEEKLAKLTERQQKEQKEAKQLKRNSVLFVIAIALVLCIGIGLIAYNWYGSSGLPERLTTAVVVGGHKISAAELNYYYIDILNSLSQDWYSTYLLQMEGLNTSIALDQQQYKDEEGRTWADYFIDEAIGEVAGIYALCDAAEAAGFGLTDEDRAQIDATLASIEAQAKTNGFGSLASYLQALYGNGAQVKTFRTYLEKSTLAQNYYNHYTEGLSYDAEALANKDKETPGYFSAFDYTYYTLSTDDFLAHDHESEEEHDHSDEEKAEALKKAEDTAKELVASGATNKEELDKAIAGLEMYQTESAEEATEETTEGTTEEATEEATEATTEETTEESTEGATEEAAEATEPAESTEDDPAAATEGEPDGDADISVETEDKDATTEETEEGAVEITTGESEEDGEEGVPGETEEEVEETTSDAPTSTSRTDYDYTYIPTEIAEWLGAEGRKVGEIGYVPYYVTDDEGEPTEEIAGYYVVILDGENKREENLVSARHILVKYKGGSVDEETGDTVYSDEDKAATKAEAEKILAEYDAGEKTADAFGELAKKYSEDNADEGGLYEDIYIGQMETGFEDWCFDEARKPGDTGVVETSYGFHVMYFVETQEETYRDYLIESALRTEETNDWFEGLRDGYKDNAQVNDTSFLNTSIVLSK